MPIQRIGDIRIDNNTGIVERFDGNNWITVKATIDDPAIDDIDDAVDSKVSNYAKVDYVPYNPYNSYTAVGTNSYKWVVDYGEVSEKAEPMVERNKSRTGRKLQR